MAFLELGEVNKTILLRDDHYVPSVLLPICACGYSLGILSYILEMNVHSAAEDNVSIGAAAVSHQM